MKYVAAFITGTALLILLLLCSCTNQDITEALKKISIESLKARITFISDDITQGRAPGSAGSIISQRYIVSQMQQIGLQPGAEDSSYYQKFDILKIDVDPTMHLTFSGEGTNLEPVYYNDYVLFPGKQQQHTEVQDAELVFAGYGIQATEFDWDDFKDTDVRGKILLIMNNDPDNGDPAFFGGKARMYYGRWDYKYEQAARMGAAGAIIIHTTESAAYPWQVVQTSWSGSQFELIKDEPSGLEFKCWVTENIASRLAEISGHSLNELMQQAQKRDFHPVPLGIKVSCNLNAGLSRITGANIIGILPGSDPELKNQAVIITAHNDHLGIRKAVHNDSIYNGALDNATGVASVLCLAEAFASLNSAPRRTLIFAAVDGEESGLLGSWFYAQHPTLDPGNIVADVNLDAGNIWGKTHDVVLVGYGKSTIDEIVSKYAKKQGRVVVPEQFPEQGGFYRSDQFSFAKIGIPGLYIDTGIDFTGRPKDWGKEVSDQWIATHYHQTNDEIEASWDMSGQIEDLDLIFRTTLELANAQGMPAWKPGAEFKR